MSVRLHFARLFTSALDRQRQSIPSDRSAAVTNNQWSIDVQPPSAASVTTANVYGNNPFSACGLDCTVRILGLQGTWTVGRQPRWSPYNVTSENHSSETFSVITPLAPPQNGMPFFTGEAVKMLGWQLTGEAGDKVGLTTHHTDTFITKYRATLMSFIYLHEPQPFPDNTQTAYMIEISHLFSVARGNPATAICWDETLCFVSELFLLASIYILISWILNRRICTDMKSFVQEAWPRLINNVRFSTFTSVSS